VRRITLFILALALPANALRAQGRDRPDASFEYDPIFYDSAPTHTTIDRLQARLDRGEAGLPWHDRWGRLPALLGALDLWPSSQSLAFAKVSFQNDRISPQTPRAIYFNDHTYVAWVPDGEVMEIAALDPRQGVIYYTLSQSPDDKPRFQRNNRDCLACHSNARAQGVPGLLVRSVYPDALGEALTGRADHVVTHRTPIADRWGGWYVSGDLDGAPHLGNAAAPASVPDARRLDLTDLSTRFNTAPYLSRHSDVAALMALEHQAGFTNLLVRANYRTRLLVARHAETARAAGRPEAEPDARTLRKLESQVETLVRYMLFVEEAPLPAPVRGTAAFAQRFSRRGPRDTQGRSLFQLDLKTRLLRYPLSYMIHTPAFDGLPEPARSMTLRRLWTVLTRRDTQPPYDGIAETDARAILEILRATKKDLPGYWVKD